LKHFGFDQSESFARHFRTKKSSMLDYLRNVFARKKQCFCARCERTKVIAQRFRAHCASFALDVNEALISGLFVGNNCVGNNNEFTAKNSNCQKISKQIMFSKKPKLILFF
jgi:hypothetical protein